jgi:hypothetical protein
MHAEKRAQTTSLDSSERALKSCTMMPNVTLDSNCIIDLEQNRPAVTYINELSQMHREGKIHLRVVAISASERKPDGTFASNFNEFKERVDSIGLADVQILKPIAYQGIAFCNYCVQGVGSLGKLEKEIQQALIPEIEIEYTDFCKKRRLNPSNKKNWGKWVNKKCDVLAMCSHIWNGGGIFVTNDGDFHKKPVKSRLIALGAGKILRPAETVELLVDSLCERED